MFGHVLLESGCTLCLCWLAVPLAAETRPPFWLKRRGLPGAGRVQWCWHRGLGVEGMQQMCGVQPGGGGAARAYSHAPLVVM